MTQGHVLRALYRVWRRFPQMRLGELLVLMNRESTPALFYMEDVEMVALLQHFSEGK